MPLQAQTLLLQRKMMTLTKALKQVFSNLYTPFSTVPNKKAEQSKVRK